MRAGLRSLRLMTVFERLNMPSLGGATGWLNSEPPGPAELRGQVVLVDFWTLTCIPSLLARGTVRRRRMGETARAPAPLHRLPDASGRCPPDPRYRIPQRDIGRSVRQVAGSGAPGLRAGWWIC
jgi:hypothetical protein